MGAALADVNEVGRRKPWGEKDLTVNDGAIWKMQVLLKIKIHMKFIEYRKT